VHARLIKMHLDLALSGLVHKSRRTGGPLEHLVAAFAYIFNPSMIAFTWLLALVLKGSLQHILVGATQVVLVLLTTTLLKRLTGRNRPELYTPRPTPLQLPKQRDQSVNAIRGLCTSSSFLDFRPYAIRAAPRSSSRNDWLHHVCSSLLHVPLRR
jgi:hypothetical protein